MIIFSLRVPLASAEGGSRSFHGTHMGRLQDSALHCVREQTSAAQLSACSRATFGSQHRFVTEAGGRRVFRAKQKISLK